MPLGSRLGTAVDHVPFFVRPETGNPTAPAAFLVPTFSYMAYGNGRHTEDTAGNFSDYFVPGFEYPVKLEDHYIVDNGLVSLYNSHTPDGSGVCHSSWLRAHCQHAARVLFGRGWPPARGSPHQLSADLHLVDWLEAEEHPYDVITDHDLHKDGLALLKSYKVIVHGLAPRVLVRRHARRDGDLPAGRRQAHVPGRQRLLLGNGPGPGVGAYHRNPALGRHPDLGEPTQARPESALPASPGGIWRDRGRAPQRMLGIGFTSQGNDVNAPYSREPGSRDPRTAFIFEGVRG